MITSGRRPRLHIGTILSLCLLCALFVSAEESAPESQSSTGSELDIQYENYGNFEFSTQVTSFNVESVISPTTIELDATTTNSATPGIDTSSNADKASSTSAISEIVTSSSTDSLKEASSTTITTPEISVSPASELNTQNAPSYSITQITTERVESTTALPVSGTDKRNTGSKCNPEGTRRVEFHEATVETCRCKDNVIGETCDKCLRGTFDLQEYHEEGCLKCYCSGISEVCEKHSFPLTQFPAVIQDIQLMEIGKPDRVIKDGINIDETTNEITYVPPTHKLPDLLYWSLPYEFTDNKIRSYGSYLNWTQSYEDSSTDNVEVYPSLLIISQYGTNLSWTDSVPLQRNDTRAVSVQLHERNFKVEDEHDTHNATREEVMKILSSIKEIRVQAPHMSQATAVSISNVSMDVVLGKPFSMDSPRETSIELCSCPEGYTGTSCEYCDSGFYPTKKGNCEKCPCNDNEIACWIPKNSTEVHCNCKTGFFGNDCKEKTEKPSIIEGPSNITVQLGDPVALTCKAKTSADTYKRWDFVSAEAQSAAENSSFIPVLERRLCKPDDVKENCKFEILRADFKDEGWYACTAYNSAGNDYAKAYLRVIKGEDTGSKDNIPEQVDLVLVVGSTLNFPCKTQNTGNAQITWTYSSSSSNHSDNETLTQFNNELVLEIPKVEFEHEGFYTCILTEKTGKVFSRRLHLSVTNTTKPPESKLRMFTTSCLRIATGLLCFFCIMVIIPIMLLWYLERRAKKKSCKSEIAN